MCDPILVTLLKMRPHYSQSSRENATPSSGTSPVASYKEVPPEFGTKKETLKQLHCYHLVYAQGVYNTCRMLCFCIKTFQTSYHFVLIFKHFVSVVVGV